MTQLTATEVFAPRINDSGGRGILQVVIADGEVVTLQGSIDGVTFTTIESFPASVIKELVLCPYFKFTATAGSTGGTQSTVRIAEVRGI